MLPVLGREVVEGQQFHAVSDQLGGGLLVLHAISFHEEIDLAIQSLKIPRLKKHYDLLVQSRQELNGEGGNSDLLMDLYSL